MTVSGCIIVVFMIFSVVGVVAKLGLKKVAGAAVHLVESQATGLRQLRHMAACQASSLACEFAPLAFSCPAPSAPYGIILVKES
jgi:hypothetical protein